MQGYLQIDNVKEKAPRKIKLQIKISKIYINIMFV